MYNYKYQGQELQETGFYSFKWREYMPDIGRFAQIDPLAAKYPYNSTYAFQENKLGLGVELEGLELLKNHTGYFAIHGNAMRVVRAPASQTDSRGNPTFTAGNIGLTTTGYNPNARSFSDGSKGLRINEYKYNGPLPSAAEMQDTKNLPTNSDVQKFKTTIRGLNMTNNGIKNLDKASNAADGIKEVKNLVDLITNLPNLFDSNKNHVQAANDVQSIQNQAMTMDQAIQTVDQSGVTMDQQTRNDVVNYVFDGTLPNPDGGLMPNSNVITIGTQIMKDNKITIQPLKEQLNTK